MTIPKRGEDPAKAEPAVQGSRAYLLSIGAGVLAALGLFLGTLEALEATGNLPPPALTNNLCLDEKLADLRERHATDRPSLVVVGSSVAWRHFDGHALVRSAPGAVPLNGGFCGLRINQTVVATDWLLRNWPSAQEVVALASPLDFADCSRVPSAMFDPADADAYVHRRSWTWGFYLRYFDPVTLFHNARSIAGMRASAPGYEPFATDAYGDSPISEHAPVLGLRYPALAGFDEGCFAALGELARKVTAEGRRFVMVLSPVHPEWVALHGPDGALMEELAARAGAALRDTAGTLWDAHQALRLGAEAFTDAIHLRWGAAQRLSSELVQVANLGSGTATGGRGGLRTVSHMPAN